MVPLLAVSFSIFQAFGGLEKLYQSLELWVLGNLTGVSGEEAMTFLRKFIGNVHAGTLGITGLIALIITSMTLLSNCEKAINRVWHTTKPRPLFQRIAAYWLFITLGPLSASMILGFSTSQDFVLPSFLHFNWTASLGSILIEVLFFFSVYFWVPHRRVHWMAATVGAVQTAILLDLAKTGYGIYTSRVLTYHKIYGSLGAIPILLLWIYIAWLVILAGVSTSAAIQHVLELTPEKEEG